jgi:tetratricopeptide (TPR) repeat protein
MPKSGSTDIPHVHITDHFISKTNVGSKKTTTASNSNADFLGLQILTKDNPSPLEMAKGYIAIFDKYLASPLMLDSAKWYLDRSKAPRKKQFSTLVHYLFARKDYGAIATLAAKNDPAKEADGWTAYRIGEAMYQTQNYAQAVAFYERSLALLPYQLDFREKLAIAYVATRQIPQAIAAFEWVLKENPKRKLALANLGYIYVSQRRFEKGEALYDKALALDPDYEQALLNKAAVRLFRNDCTGAAPLLQRILKRNPGNSQARRALAQCGG